MKCKEATKLMDGYLDGELDPITNQTPRCGPTPERGVFAKTRSKSSNRKAGIAENYRRISGIKSSRISKDRCEATCQVTKPKTNIMSDYISHDDEHDGIDRRGFLHCMAWAGTGLLWTISGHLISEQQLNLNLKLNLCNP